MLNLLEHSVTAVTNIQDISLTSTIHSYTRLSLSWLVQFILFIQNCTWRLVMLIWQCNRLIYFTFWRFTPFKSSMKSMISLCCLSWSKCGYVYPKERLGTQSGLFLSYRLAGLPSKIQINGLAYTWHHNSTTWNKMLTTHSGILWWKPIHWF